MSEQNSEQSENSTSRFKLPTLPVWVKLLMVVTVVTLASIGYFKKPSQDGQSGAEVQGSSDLLDQKLRKPLPTLEFTDQKGKAISIQSLKGNVILLSFWASWCTPCIVELPTFIELHKRFTAKGLVVFPINVDEQDPETRTTVDEYWKTRKFPFPTFFDLEKKSATTMGVESLPTNLLVDRQGKIVALGTGANDWSSEQAMNLIDQLLAEQSAK